MKEITTLNFTDQDQREEGVIIVRANADVVGLCLSLKSGSDVEVFLDRKTVRATIQALEKALAVS